MLCRPYIHHDPRVLPFQEWRYRYAYFVECMLHCISVAAANTTDACDWPNLRSDLERHLYATSANRFVAFRLIK
jgi:hypothetical protein